MLLLSVTRLKCLARGGAGGAKSKMRGGPAALFAVRVLPAACACARSYGSESTSTGDTSAPPPPLARKPSEVIGLPSYHGNAPRLEETMERKLTSPRIMPIQNLGTHSVGVSRRVVAARNKCVSINDAVMAVVSHDTLVCSGFQGQGGPEGLLRALAERYVRTGAPHSLTLLFNAGPGDTNTQGLNNLALTVEDVAEDVRAKYPDLPPMVARTVGSHYGVLPKLSELILKNKIEAFTLPIGVTTRIVRCAAGHQPGLFSTTGMHTYIDPRLQGGKINQKAKDSKFSPVSLVQVDGMDHLFYRAMPVHVAFIRATTADPDGNLTMEHESLMAEQRNIAMAAKNSGGVVIAQVKRVAQSGSLPIRNVAVPGCFVDCVVVISPDQYDELHPMSYATPHNPSLTHEVRPTLEDTPRMPLTNRKVIARRASMLLKANKVINLGIGLPEHIASVCAEEDILQQLVLSTEAGCLGGVPAFNADYGPAASPMALQEMNQQYDFYGGGGLDICFLGAGAVNELGHVQVFSHTNVRGPGAFIDISQNTRNVIFLMNFKIKGLQVEVQDGRMNIKKEGKVRKFVAGPLEDVAFSAAEAWRRGQEVFIITERCVFGMSARSTDMLREGECAWELLEIAPGVNLEMDVLDQMGFIPKISPFLSEMDPAIFREEPMGLKERMFGKDMEQRCTYNHKDHVLYLDMSGYVFNTREIIDQEKNALEKILQKICRDKGKVDVLANYDNFDCRVALEEYFRKQVAYLQNKYYKSVSRYTTIPFRRNALATAIGIASLSPIQLFKAMDQDGNNKVTALELRKGVRKLFGLNLTAFDIYSIIGDRPDGIALEVFAQRMSDFLSKRRPGFVMKQSNEEDDERLTQAAFNHIQGQEDT